MLYWWRRVLHYTCSGQGTYIYIYILHGTNLENGTARIRSRKEYGPSEILGASELRVINNTP